MNKLFSNKYKENMDVYKSCNQLHCLVTNETRNNVNHATLHLTK